MEIDNLDHWQHEHNFGTDFHVPENKTKLVLLVTAFTMVAEIIVGSLLGSMALLADGWHMATHVAAFGITVFAYQYARRHASNPTYTFGTGKVTVLGAFTSAIALVVIAVMMALESLIRLISPYLDVHFHHHITQFDDAIGVAVLGLGVNLLSAALLNHHSLHEDSNHPPSHTHSDSEYIIPFISHKQSLKSMARDDIPFPKPHPHPHPHRDPNLYAAYVHVLADILTSILAIVALLAGKFWGWIWLDTAMGLVGAMVISNWSYGLVRESGMILLDGTIDRTLKATVVEAIERNGEDLVTDIHIWHLSPHKFAATLSLLSDEPQPPHHYKQRLSHIPSLAYLVVEVHSCAELPVDGLNSERFK